MTKLMWLNTEHLPDLIKSGAEVLNINCILKMDIPTVTCHQ